MIADDTTYEWFGDSISASGKHQWKTELETNQSWYGRDIAAPVVLGNLIFVRNGHYRYSPVTAIEKSNGSIVWQIDETVVSNIAVAGARIYFVTENAQLMVIDTQTGQVLGSANFVPSFNDDFDFVNTSIYVAADNDIVAIYFGDGRQLSILRFNQ